MNINDSEATVSGIPKATQEVIVVTQNLEAQGSGYIIYIIGVVALLLVLWVMRRGKSKSSKKQIGIVGERGAGKTQLFIGLTGGKQFQTVPSIANNTGEIQVGRKTYQLCDFMGDNLSKEEVLSQIARFHTLVHVIDGADSKKLGDAASFIYRVLVNKQFQKDSCNYILFFNKSDLSSFHSSEKLAKRIEDEIETIKVTRRNGTEDNEEGEEDYLRKEKTRFDLKREGIEIVVGSGKKNKATIVDKLEELCG